MEAPRPKRFLKKLPPSGGRPAYKLTLPHQMCSKYLLHLLNVDFELATSATTTQTWQASLVSRRNKERSEYLLQGWKLFAEAHDIRAGDQISFELVGQARLVLQVVKPADTDILAASLRRPADSMLPSSSSPTKSIKHAPESNPSRSTSFERQEEVHRAPEWFDECLTEESLINDLWSDIPVPDQEVPKLDSPGLTDIQPLVVGVYKTRDSNFCKSVVATRLGNRVFSSPDANIFKFKQEGRSVSWVGEAAAEAPAALAPCNTPQTPARSTLSKLSSVTEAQPGLPLLGQLLDKEVLFAGELSGPSPVCKQPQVSPQDSGLANSESLDSSTGSFMRNSWDQHMSSTLNNLHTEARDLHRKANRSEDEAQHFKALFTNMQIKVDRQVREALRATIGLEECMASLRLLADRTDNLTQAQSNMNKHITTLKEKMWQMLVLSMSDDCRS